MEKIPDAYCDLVKHIAPVLAGTAVSMFFMRTEWPRRIAQGVIGVPFSLYMAPFVDRVLSGFMMPYDLYISPSEAGVVTAVFGLTIVSYLYEVLQQLQIGPILRDFIKNKLGVKDVNNEPKSH